MFEDLVPSAPAQTPAPPPGVFDDLIPSGAAAGVASAAKLAAPERADEQALPRSTAGTDPGDERIEPPARNGQLAVAASDQTNAPDGASAPPRLFDDLIPAAARGGGAVGGAQGAVVPAYEPVFDPWLGLKDRKTGIPLVREFKPGRFIADIAGEDDGGVYWKDPKTGEIRRQGFGELIVPEGGKYKVYERLENIRPWTWTDMALIQAIKSGFTAPHDAIAGDMSPSEVIPRAVDTASLAVSGTTFTPWRIPPRAPGPAERPPIDLPPLHQDARIIGQGPHGPIIEGYQGRWTDVVDWLRRAQTGDALAVLSHPDVPAPIDVVWGTKDYGLAHIIAKHPGVVEDLPSRLGRMSKISESENRIRLSDGTTIAVISRNWLGEPKTWLLTALEPVTRRGGGSMESPSGLPGPTRSSGPPGDPM
jgi:hypothetical protein